MVAAKSHCRRHRLNAVRSTALTRYSTAPTSPRPPPRPADQPPTATHIDIGSRPRLSSQDDVQSRAIHSHLTRVFRHGDFTNHPCVNAATAHHLCHNHIPPLRIGRTQGLALFDASGLPREEEFAVRDDELRGRCYGIGRLLMPITLCCRGIHRLIVRRPTLGGRRARRTGRRRPSGPGGRRARLPALCPARRCGRRSGRWPGGG